MKVSKIWEFVGSHFISLATVLLGVAVILLDQINLVPDKSIPLVTLAIVTLLATSEIIENRKNIANLNDRLDLLGKQVSEALNGIQVINFVSTEEALSYLLNKTKSARRSIDQAALDEQRISANHPSRKQYVEGRDKAIITDRVRYRYLGVLYSRTRLERNYRLLKDNNLYNYFVRFYQRPNKEIPLLGFVIFDEEEVFTRYPFDSGEDPGYVLIRSPEVTKLFINYFEKLWQSSYKLRDENDYKFLEKDISA